MKILKHRSLAIAFTLLFMLAFSNYSVFADEKSHFEKGEAELINQAYKDVEPAAGEGAVAIPKAAVYVSSKSQLQNILYEAMTERKSSLNVVYTGYTSDMISDMRAVLEKTLEIDDYLKYSYVSVSYGYSGYQGNYNIYYNPSYLTTKAQEDYVDSRVDYILDEIITDKMTSFEKEVAIHDYIVKNVEYDVSLVQHSAYAALAYGKTVCQGYSLLAYKMFEEAGLQSRIIGSDYMNHAWNLVNVDGYWYHADLTWDDPVPDVKGRTVYEYFNMSDYSISKDHYWDEASYPSCTSNKYIYMSDVSYLVFDGDCIYYSSNYDDKLYKINMDGTGKQNICSDRAFFLCGYGDWIYFSNFSQGGHIYKIRTDGTAKQQVNSVYSTNLRIEGSSLVFKNGDTGMISSIVLESLVPESIELSQLSMTIEKGSSSQLVAVSYPQGVPAQILWSSSDANVASVDSNGKVAADSAGICIIKAEIAGTGISASCSVKVEDSAEVQHADVFGYKTASDTKKIWTVKFNKGVSKEADIANMVRITQGGAGVGAAAVLGVDGDSIEIVPPQEGYVRGKSYRLQISGNIESTGGEKILKPVVFYFMVE